MKCLSVGLNSVSLAVDQQLCCVFIKSVNTTLCGGCPTTGSSILAAFPSIQTAPPAGLV